MFVDIGPFEWIFQHLPLIGWPAVGLAIWKASRYIERVTSQAAKAATQIDSLATNHFPHMQESLAKQDVYLASIDKNIERMADKL